MPLYLMLVIFGFGLFAVVLFSVSVWTNNAPKTSPEPATETVAPEASNESSRAA